MPPVVLICRDIDIHFAVPSGNGFFMQEWHAHCSLFKWQLNHYTCTYIIASCYPEFDIESVEKLSSKKKLFL